MRALELFLEDNEDLLSIKWEVIMLIDVCVTIDESAGFGWDNTLSEEVVGSDNVSLQLLAEHLT